MSLGDNIRALIVEQGRQAAQARAQTGAVWGGALRDTGQQISNVFAQAADPRRQLEQQQVAQGKVQASDLQALDKAFTTPGGREQVLAQLPGHLRPQVAASFTAADEAAAKLNKAQFEAESATNAYTYQLASEIKAHGYDPTAAQFALSHAKQTFANNPSLLQQVGQFESQLHANPTPDAVRAFADPIIAQHDAEEKPVLLPATPRGGSPATLVRPSGGPPVATGAAAQPAAPTQAELALKAAQGDPDAIAAMNRLKPPAAPRSLDEQLLEAITKGDQPAASRITETLRKAAQAKQDPAALAQLGETRRLSAAEAQQRLDKLKEENQPIDIAPQVQTTLLGGNLQYLDSSKYGKGELAKARKAAEAAGVPIVSKETADGLVAADRAATTLDSMWAQVKPFLPTGAGGRLVGGPKNTLEKLFQSNPTLGAFGTWRTAAVQAVQALAEKGMGLRLNQAEISNLLEGLPKITDDAPTAEQKMKNIGIQLESKVKNALTHDRSGLAVPGGVITPQQPPQNGVVLTPGLAGLAGR